MRPRPSRSAIPLALAVRFRWVVRLGLIAYALTTIVAWAIQGPYFTTAYVAEGIEVALIALVAIDFARMDGNPVDGRQAQVRRLHRLRRRTARLGRRRSVTIRGTVVTTRRATNEPRP